MARKAPNILLIMVDQLAPQVLPGYGHPVVKAPNLTRLFIMSERVGGARAQTAQGGFGCWRMTSFSTKPRKGSSIWLAQLLRGSLQSLSFPQS